ncbi:MAG: hypothetical protein M0021_00335 [Clostridia bacterium]|nr:hypothetical protein [Clostridia bacterium]
MKIKRVFNSEFEKVFNGTLILDQDIEDKLDIKHKVYRDDLFDAFSDPYLVVMKTKQKSPISKNVPKSKGTVYEILCEAASGRVLFVVGRLFPDGNMYIITAYWADTALEDLYRHESEVLRDE